MTNYLFDQNKATKALAKFFKDEKPKVDSFGRMVNQTFEAYTFASTIKWYQDNGWTVVIKNPVIKKKSIFKLKFSTRGAPKNFSYALCTKENEVCQIRHQLRISVRAHRDNYDFQANICCDIAVIKDLDLSNYTSDVPIDNKHLLTFGEVKHMSAFAELVAGFVGMVHELQPERLKRIRTASWIKSDQISPYMNVSGYLQPTAKGLNETIEKRKYDIDIYSYNRKIIS